MQHILLRGFKKIPWNETRKGLVELFFPQEMLPYVDPVTTIERISQSETTPGSSGTARPALQTPGSSGTAQPALQTPGSSGIARPALPVFVLPVPGTPGPSGPRTSDVVLDTITAAQTRNLHPRHYTQIAEWRTDKGCFKFWQQVELYSCIISDLELN